MKTRLVLRYFLSFVRRAVGFLALVVGTLGFVILGVDPMQWITPYLPIQYAGLSVDAAYVESLLATTQTNYVVLGSVIAVSLLLVLSAVILLVQSPKRAVKGFIRSPLSSVRGIIRARNWLLAKVEYLNSESAKWRQLFNVAKSPYSLLRAMGLSPQMAIGLLFAGSTVGGGVIVNETILSEASFSRGDPGVYNAPLDTPVFADQEYNTLRLDLGATSVGNITIENVSLGTAYTGSALPSGESNVIYVGGIVASSNPTFNQTYLEVGHLIIDRWRCERLDISHSEIHTLIVRGNASDGQSISAVAGTPRDRGINGGNRADDMTTQGGYYDMLKITSASSGVNGKVDVLRLSNLYSKGGACTIKYVKAGTMEVTLNEIGGDETLSTKAFTIATSVIFKSFINEENVEVSMPVPAAQ
jgi:hypothetical protein